MEPLDILKHYFGYPSFRPGQKEVIDTLLQGQDCLAIMPTGAGKSLCYQIPGLLLPGITLIISPLISLMKDQVDGLADQDIPATFINSQCTLEESRSRFRDIRAGRMKLVYVSPERLENNFFRSFMADIPVSMVIIDEAHCVSQWGHDFRPSYCAIKGFVEGLPERPVVGAFTATATEQVKSDMLELLGLSKARVFIGGFDRPNLDFRVVQNVNKLHYTISYVQEHEEDSGIIYCATRKAVDQVYEALRQQGLSAGRYHAGLTDKVRKKMQEDFTYDKVRVMVATNAFGMGIDKSNVRYVLHFQMPKNMESYYQEAGRAGRDGLPSECVLLFSWQDKKIQEFLIEKSVEEYGQKIVESNLLKKMVEYCQTTHCLRHFILTYFGEQPEWQECHNCGNCEGEVITEDHTEEARIICECVSKMHERFGASLTADVLHGTDNEKIRKYGFDQLFVYGRLGEYTLPEIRDMIAGCVEEELLAREPGRYPTLYLTAKGHQVLTGKGKVLLKHKAAVKKEAAAKAKAGKTKSAAPATDKKKTSLKGKSAAKPLFEELRALRLDLSHRIGKPPYVIFPDTTLWEMAEKRPASLEELQDVKGVGEKKLEKYGQIFLQAIREFSK